MRDTINEVIRGRLFGNEKKRRITGEERLNEDLGFDSLETMETIIECEGRFGKQIPNRNIKDIHQVKDLYRLFEN